jgi:prophage DNA circulation protein
MKALTQDSTTTNQVVVDFINAANDVSRYAEAIAQAQLPDLVQPPANYGDYANTMANAKINVGIWMDEVVPGFEVIPTSFLGFKDLIQQQFTIIQTALETLQQTPNDPDAISRVDASTAQLITETQSNQAVIKQLDTDISSYQGTIAPDAKSLTALSSQIATAENADEQAIKKMQACFDNLQSVVDDRNELATLDTLSAVDEGIFLAVVGIAVGIVFTGGAGIVIGGLIGVG